MSLKINDCIVVNEGEYVSGKGFVPKMHRVFAISDDGETFFSYPLRGEGTLKSLRMHPSVVAERPLTQNSLGWHRIGWCFMDLDNLWYWDDGERPANFVSPQRREAAEKDALDAKKKADRRRFFGTIGKAIATITAMAGVSVLIVEWSTIGYKLWNLPKVQRAINILKE